MSDTVDITGRLTIVQVSGRGDPALDRENPALIEAVQRHAIARDAASLDALRACVVEGKRLVEYELAPLSPAAMSYLSGLDDAARPVVAFRAACVAVRDAEGVRVEAKIARGAGGKSDGTFPMAPFAWYEQWCGARGLGAIREVGAVAYRRGEVGEDDRDFYWPLAGVPRLAV